MSVQDIEMAIKELSTDEISQLASWFDEFQADLWDKQIASDSVKGKFDSLIQRANDDFDAGRCTPM